MKTGKAVKKHREHRAVPHNKIAKMWYEGKTYLQIGKAIDRLAEKGDLTKPVRAIISRMLNEGWTDENGKTIVLKPREGMRAIGVGVNAPGNGKVKATGSAKKTVARGRKAGSNGPAVVIAMHASNKFVRLEVGKAKALPKTTDILPSLIDVVQKAGYTVTQNVPAEAAPVSEETAANLKTIEDAAGSTTPPVNDPVPEKETPGPVSPEPEVPLTPTIPVETEKAA